jgi:catechol 2,3-dioxygenase-like lactoylglutathione lyase family enzyme
MHWTHRSVKAYGAAMSSLVRFGFAVEYVKDIEAATRFYVDVLGLEVQRTHPSFVQFESFALASDESLSGTDETELYWLVDDADAAFSEMSQKAELSFSMRQLPFGKVFALKDPAGRALYVLELARSRPSTAVR